MKEMFQRFLSFVKSLFLCLRVMVTLRLGKDKVNETEASDEDLQKGQTHENKDE